MKAWLQHPVRVTIRALWLAGELALMGAVYAIRHAFRSGPSSLVARATWLHRSCRRLLRALGVETQSSGSFPSGGLLVSNHLSYLDIVVLAAGTPAVFVAKREVKSWPVFGWYASLAGTLFVDRERRTHVGQMTGEIQNVLDRGLLVILFPEGTSSDGRTVLPFKSALLEPAARQTHPLFAGLIRYDLDDGDVGREVCYWGDMTLLPHLANLIGKRAIRASVRFTPLHPGNADRKELARQLHSEVLKLKETFAV
jgi:lyso-ornithine lipid O-acyltransferase